MSKKILSLALAVIMLFSVCAVAANAAVADGATVGIRVESDAKVGDPKDTVVTVSVYYDLPDGADLQMVASNTAIAWNSAKYKLNSSSTSNAKDAREWGDAYADYFKSTAAVTCSASVSGKIVALFNDADTAKGWDAACQVQQTYNTDNASSTEGFPIHSGEVVFKLSFVALDTITAADVIGVVQGAYGENYFTVKEWTGNNQSTIVGSANVDFASSYAAPEAAAVEYDVKNIMGKNGAIADKHLNGDGTCTVAVFYGFDSALIAPDFDDNGTSNSIEAITATVTATVGEQSATKTAEPIRFVYDLGSGMYGFRVIIKNVDVNADVVVTPALTLNGTVDYSVETVSFNVSAAEAL